MHIVVIWSCDISITNLLYLYLIRFSILKMVRRDLICELPLPRRLIDYLNTPHYYCEQLGSTDSSKSTTPTPAVHLISFTPP